MPDGMTPEQPNYLPPGGFNLHNEGNVAQNRGFIRNPGEKINFEEVDPSEAYRRQQDEYARQAQDRDNQPRYELPATTRLNFWIERGIVPENGELIKDYRNSGIEMLDPLLQLQIDARTRFNFSDYSVGRMAEIMDNHSREFQQAVQSVDSFEDLGGPELSGLAKVVNENLIRIGAFHKLENHTIGFKQFYYDAKGAFSLLATGRRHGAVNTGDWMAMFSPLPEEMRLTDEEKNKLIIPEKEHIGAEVSRMTADIEHFERAVGAMNRYNPFKPAGEEMFMEVSEVEQHLLGSLFTIDIVKDDSGSSDKPNFEPNRTQMITIPVEQSGKKVDKKFYTNILSYYVTADPEKDRRKYEATMKALAEVDALSTLKKLPRVWDHVKDDPSRSITHLTSYTKLMSDVEKARDRILRNWNSLVKPYRARLADFAYEQNFNVQTGTQNIAELSYRFKWKKTNGVWDFTAEIPGPETGQDAVNGRNPITHELIYKVLKGRGVTKMMPWPKKESVNEMIKIALMETRGKDPKPIILSRPGLAKGAATIGLYGEEALDKLEVKDREEVAKSRQDMQLNETALKVLDSMLWIYDLSAEGCYLPMPIKPMYDSFNLYKVMRDKVTGKTVFEMLHEEGQTLRDIKFENIVWYATDAWEVNMKMIEDVLQMMYGRQDPKYMDSFLTERSGGIGEMIKKLDIGTRAEKWEIDVRKSLEPKLPNGDPNPEYEQREKIEVPKGFIEIMQIAYLAVTHTALVKRNIWDKAGWIESNQKNYWEDIQSWVTVALYEPSEKAGFKRYNETLALMIIAIAEWYADAAVSYNNEAAGLKDKVDQMTPRKVKYTEPSPGK